MDRKKGPRKRAIFGPGTAPGRKWINTSLFPPGVKYGRFTALPGAKIGLARDCNGGRIQAGGTYTGTAHDTRSRIYARTRMQARALAGPRHDGTSPGSLEPDRAQRSRPAKVRTPTSTPDPAKSPRKKPRFLAKNRKANTNVCILTQIFQARYLSFFSFESIVAKIIEFR